MDKRDFPLYDHLFGSVDLLYMKENRYKLSTSKIADELGKPIYQVKYQMWYLGYLKAENAFNIQDMTEEQMLKALLLYGTDNSSFITLSINTTLFLLKKFYTTIGLLGKVDAETQDIRLELKENNILLQKIRWERASNLK